MLFRPSYCCNCGERIERTEWTLGTSRRFCKLCATDMTVQDWAPRIVVRLALVVLAVGAVNFVAGSGGRRELAVTRPATRAVEQPKTADVAPPAQEPVRPVSAQTQAAASDERTAAPRTLAALDPPAAARPAPVVSDPVYYCGAETKKGTPCSRKVKGNVRCWQHAGMPAMVPADKLLVSR